MWTSLRLSIHPLAKNRHAERYVVRDTTSSIIRTHGPAFHCPGPSVTTSAQCGPLSKLDTPKRPLRISRMGRQINTVPSVKTVYTMSLTAYWGSLVSGLFPFTLSKQASENRPRQTTVLKSNMATFKVYLGKHFPVIRKLQKWAPPFLSV